MNESAAVVLFDAHFYVFALPYKFDRKRRDHKKRRSFRTAAQQRIVERVPLGIDCFEPRQ